jgi:hypothetical protein
MHCLGSLAFILANKLAGTSVRWHITHVAGRMAPGLAHGTCWPLRSNVSSGQAHVRLPPGASRYVALDTSIAVSLS